MKQKNGANNYKKVFMKQSIQPSSQSENTNKSNDKQSTSFRDKSKLLTRLSDKRRKKDKSIGIK